MSEAEELEKDRDANTARLKALRLAKATGGHASQASVLAER